MLSFDYVVMVDRTRSRRLHICMAYRYLLPEQLPMPAPIWAQGRALSRVNSRGTLLEHCIC